MEQVQGGDNTHFQVWVWGSGACLALGSSDATMLRPRPIEELAGLRIVDISAGDSHALALTHEGEVRGVFLFYCVKMLYGQ